MRSNYVINDNGHTFVRKANAILVIRQGETVSRIPVTVDSRREMEIEIAWWHHDNTLVSA